MRVVVSMLHMAAPLRSHARAARQGKASEGATQYYGK